MKLLQIITAADARIQHCHADPQCVGFMQFADLAGNMYCETWFSTDTYELHRVKVHVPGQTQLFEWNSQQTPDCAFLQHVLHYVIDDFAYLITIVQDIGSMYYDDLPNPDDYDTGLEP